MPPLAAAHARRRSSLRRVANPRDLIVDRALAKMIKTEIANRGITQTQAAHIMRDAPSQISLVTTYKLRGISRNRLMSMLTKAGFNVEIRVRRAVGRRGRVVVV